MRMRADIPDALFQSLDDLINVEFKSKRAMLGGTRLRYDAVRGVCGMPLVRKAAEVLGGLAPKGTVFVTTGAGNPVSLPKGETDGPPGAAVLAAELKRRGHPIVLLADLAFLGPIIAAFNAYGFDIGADGCGDGIIAQAFPLGAEAGAREVEALLGAHPDAAGAIFVEKPGPNRLGVFHNSSGKPKPAESVAHLHLLAHALSARGLPSLGIGDGGNEIGFGFAEAAVQAALPVARDCGCPCGGGIADATPVQAFVTAATSNWGAYGVLAALLMQSGGSMPEADLLRLSVEAAVAAGAHDGYSGLPELKVDATDLEANLAIYRLCQSLLAHAEALA